MSGNRQRKARRKAERERFARERRRRTVIAGILVLATVVVGAVAFGVLRSYRANLATQQSEDARLQDEAELQAAEASGEAQSAAAAAAVAAGGIVADDFSVEPGTAVDSGLRPVPDDRPVACGSEEPANAGDTRPRYPGGPAAEVIEDGVDYVAVVETSCGTITIDLLEEGAPLTVNSFVFLAREGFFDGLEIFRNFGSISALQSGSGDNSVGWDIGYGLPDEPDVARSDGYPIGSVTTSNDSTVAGGSQFFLVYGDDFERGFETNRIYTNFGEVLEGLDVLQAIAAMELGGFGETPRERIYMEIVTIEER